MEQKYLLNVSDRSNGSVRHLPFSFSSNKLFLFFFLLNEANARLFHNSIGFRIKK